MQGYEAEFREYCHREYASFFGGGKWQPFDNCKRFSNGWMAIEQYLADAEDSCVFTSKDVSNSKIFAANLAVRLEIMKHGLWNTEQGDRIALAVLQFAYPNNLTPWILRSKADVMKKVPKLFVNMGKSKTVKDSLKSVPIKSTKQSPKSKAGSYDVPNPEALWAP